jgi:D-lactate dehydrogenase (cytochrome)
VDEQISIVQKIAEKTKGTGFRFAVDDTERESLWTARKVALWASPVLKPGADIWITDVCVPISRLADCIEQTKTDLAKSPLPAPMVAHAGDGNFHLFILFDSKNPQEYLEAKKINTRLVQRAIAMEGTCTGEHGVGFGKRDYLVEELGTEAVDLMRTLKDALDPKGLFNPGKILPQRNQPSKAL